MAWKRKSTSTTAYCDVDLAEFDEEQLLQGLIDAKWLSGDEAEAIRLRAGTSGAAVSGFLGELPSSDIERARVEARRGRADEARIYLARALGRDFDPIFAN